MKRLFLIIFLILCASVPLCRAEDKDGSSEPFKISIEVPRRVYAANEDMPIKRTFENLCSFEIDIMPLYTENTLIIDGEEHNHHSPASGEYLVFPGQQISDYMRLSWFGIRKGYLKPGRHEMVWKIGGILSNKVEFDLRPPISERKIRLSIKADKKVYEVEEDIYIDYCIENLSDTDIELVRPFDDNKTVNSRMLPGNFLIKRLSDGRVDEVKFLNERDPVLSDDTVFILKKGNSYCTKMDIINPAPEAYLIGSKYGSSIFMKQPGKYSIEAVYMWTASNEKKLSPSAITWTGLAVSNEVIIEIKDKVR